MLNASFGWIAACTTSQSTKKKPNTWLIVRLSILDRNMYMVRTVFTAERRDVAGCLLLHPLDL